MSLEALFHNNRDTKNPDGDICGNLREVRVSRY